MGISTSQKLIKLLIFNLLGSAFFSITTLAETQVLESENQKISNTSYLDSRNKMVDYIIDTGDSLIIDFIKARDLSGRFNIDEEGEIFLPRIKNVFVRGLTIQELKRMLEKRFEEYLINPKMNIRIVQFKSVRFLIKGEVRNPGIYKFSPYYSDNSNIQLKENERNPFLNNNLDNSKNIDNNYIGIIDPVNNNNIINPGSIESNAYTEISNPSQYINTLTNAIQEAGGLTSYSDISKIEIIRKIPIGKGGGKKRALISLKSFIEESDNSYDIRIFNGDSIFIPRLKKEEKSIIRKSILSGISPKFISVEITGRIESPGIKKIPFEGSLSDIMNLSGPRKPLSGKIYLIRYNQDGTLTRKSIRYSASASPGSLQNPYLADEDLINVQNSFAGRLSGTLKAITDPFVGIYATKELIETMKGE